MKFSLTRTSSWRDDAKPCPWAKFKKTSSEHWEIDIDGLDGLLEFIMQHGKIVVSVDRYNYPRSAPHIEIYDDYRE